mgnify:CR=1 FL=1
MNEKENFKQDNHGETNQDDEIKDFTPASQRRKTQEQLLSVVGDFMMDEIKKLSKAKKKKHKQDKQYKSSSGMFCSVCQ